MAKNRKTDYLAGYRAIDQQNSLMPYGLFFDGAAEFIFGRRYEILAHRPFHEPHDVFIFESPKRHEPFIPGIECQGWFYLDGLAPDFRPRHKEAHVSYEFLQVVRAEFLAGKDVRGWLISARPEAYVWPDGSVVKFEDPREELLAKRPEFMKAVVEARRDVGVDHSLEAKFGVTRRV